MKILLNWAEVRIIMTKGGGEEIFLLFYSVPYILVSK
jgi:hypothetical protein